MLPRSRTLAKPTRRITRRKGTRHRFAVLLDRQVVAQNEYDQYIATARVDAAKVDSYREAAGSALKTIAARGADVDAAKAALDQALLNLSYTKIYAPANGIVGKRGVELGSRIEPGQTLMFVTETDEIWVTANFKETQLARMHPGQKVTIHVDTFGRSYQGYVKNLPGASGDRFSLLPSGKRHWQLRKGSPAAASANHVRRGPGSRVICCIPECRWSPRYGCAKRCARGNARSAGAESGAVRRGQRTIRGRSHLR